MTTTDWPPDEAVHAPPVKTDDAPILPSGTTVLQVIPALVTGGAERGCVDVAAAIMAAGGRAIVVSAGGPMVRDVERSGARHVTLPVDRKSPVMMARNVWRLRDLIGSAGVDIVHARSRAPAWSALAAARLAGVPFVTTVHSPYSAKSRLKRLYNSVMCRGDRVIAISGFIADHVRSTYGVSDERLVTIHRGIDLDSFHPHRVSAERIVRLARAWALPDGVPVVMLPGRLTRWKGATVLVDAMAQLGSREAVCVLVGADQGRTRYREEVADLIAARKLAGTVRIVGNCDDMAAAYMLADVVISASTEPEAFGRIIVEAQAMGRPVVVSDLGAVDETVLRDRTGWVVPAGDPVRLAGAIDAALSLGEAQRAALAVAARAHVVGRFDRRRMCADTLATYAELLRPIGG